MQRYKLRALAGWLSVNVVPVSDLCGRLARFVRAFHPPPTAEVKVGLGQNVFVNETQDGDAAAAAQ